jgi:hypothetical protein
MTDAYVSQVPVEVLLDIEPDDRISQVSTEVLLLPTTAQERVSQVALEALVFLGVRGRASQVALEVMIYSGGAAVVTGRVKGPAVQCV